jgi:TolB-like protein/Tfp pilus assembly protein PilF
VTDPSHAVFLSYASQDAEAAQKICEALRSAGIEVWFDQSELRGGDAWDHKIRQEIHDCALFLPIVSQHTQDRLEGYFRHEWNLAVERTHHMARQKPFLVPLVVDETSDRAALVPEEFRAVQWTRLPNGETPPAFVERIQRLLAPEASTANRLTEGAVGTIRAPVQSTLSRKRGLLAAIGLVIVGAIAYFAIEKLWIAKPSVSSPTVAVSGSPAAFTPPPHSIAVLPFVNMSGDKDQEYFSDGLTEELLNSLAEINELQVAARTSAFSFKGTNTDIGTIGRKLNVGAVLEGSVRRSGNTVRITTQLINAVTGFRLWSHSYDRDVGDVLKLETEIANAVASGLKVSLLGDVATKIELGGTRIPAAFDAYLRARKANVAAHENKDRLLAIAAYTEAIGLDRNYALAFANRSIALSGYAAQASGPVVRESFDKAQSDARTAIALAPDLAEGHLALADYLENGALDFTRANEESERALALAPGNALVLRIYGISAVRIGRTEAGIAAARRAVALDPLNLRSHRTLGQALYWGRQNKEAIAAFQDTLALDPEDLRAYGVRGLAYYEIGNLERARSSCETKPDHWVTQICLAVVYDKLGRHSDAESMLAKMKASLGDDFAYEYAKIYAQWGNAPKALEWLDTAMRLRDPGLAGLKVEPLLDPLRSEPRFQAIQRALKFPD